MVEPRGNTSTHDFRAYLEAWERGDLRACERLERKGDARFAGRVRALRALSDVQDMLSGEVPDIESPEDIPGHLDRFEQLECVGIGGQSRVYRAWDALLERHVALKVFDSKGGRGVVTHEGAALAQLTHPGIVRVFDVGESEGHAYLAMELIDGLSLARVIELWRSQAGDSKTLESEEDPTAHREHELTRALSPVRERVALLARIARALDYGHSNDVVHRDLKPGNVLVGADLGPKLIDYGLAHRELPGDSKSELPGTGLYGTAAYVAPEQLEARRTGNDPRSDQFALGVLAVELLTEKHPFEHEQLEDTWNAIRVADPGPLPSIQRDLARILRRALARQPGDRYPTTGELASDLEAWLDQRPLSIGAANPLRALLGFVRRHAQLMALSFGLILISITAFAAWNASWQRSVHDGLELELNGIVARLPEFGDAPDYERALLALENVSKRAEELYRPRFARTMLPGIADAEAAALISVSEHMSQGLRREHARIDSLDRELRAQATLQLLFRWNWALRLEEQLCPGCTSNLRDRTRGQLELAVLPAGFTQKLERFEVRGLVPYPERSPARPDDSHTGLHRLIVRDPQGRVHAELEVHVDPTIERRLLTPSPLAEGLAATLIPIRATRVQAGSRHGTGTTGHDVRAFSIGVDPVTWSDIETAFGEDIVRQWKQAYLQRLTEEAGQGGSQGELDTDLLTGYARVSALVADNYAQEVGARLPTPGELQAARGTLIQPETERLLPDALGEWTSLQSSALSNHRITFRYHGWNEDSGEPSSEFWSEELDRSAHPHLLFRIARSAD